MKSINSSNHKNLSASSFLVSLNFGDLIFTIALFVSMFFLLTNAIPFRQAGVLDFEVTKKFCVRLSRFTLIVTFFFFALWAIKWPASFLNTKPVRFFSNLSTRALVIALGILFTFYVTLMTAVGWMRHWALETRAFDLGIFAQAIGNTLHGNLLYSSIKGGICLLGDHVSPILIFLTPLYAVWPDPKSLIFIQALLAGASLFPIAYIAQWQLKNRLITLIFAVIFFFYLPTRSALHEDFHPEVLIEPFLLLAFIFLEKGKFFLFSLCLITVVLAKENMYGITFAFGIYAALWKPKYQKLGFSLSVISVILFFFSVRWIVPHFGGQGYLYEGFYIHLIKNPLEAAKVLSSAETWEYFFKVFGPFLFLPFFHVPTLLLAAPVFIQNLFSNNPVMRSFAYHYTTGMSIFLFVSTIYGFKALMQKNWLRQKMYLLAFALLFASLLRSGPSEYFYFYDSLSHKTPRRDHIRQKLAQIPDDVSVLSHNNFIPQIINRKEIYQFDYRGRPTKAESAKELNVDYVILDREFMEPATLDILSSVAELTAAGYALEYGQDGFYILKKPLKA